MAGLLPGNTHELSRQVAAYISRASPADDQNRSLKSIAWNLQEGAVSLQDLVRLRRDRCGEPMRRIEMSRLRRR